MPEVREDQRLQSSSIQYNIMESLSLPPADGLASLQRPVGGHSQGSGTRTNERRDACRTAETLVSCSSSAHGITELLEPCNQSVLVAGVSGVSSLEGRYIGLVVHGEK